MDYKELHVRLESKRERGDNMGMKLHKLATQNIERELEAQSPGQKNGDNKEWGGDKAMEDDKED